MPESKPAMCLCVNSDIATATFIFEHGLNSGHLYCSTSVVHEYVWNDQLCPLETSDVTCCPGTAKKIKFDQ